MGQVPQWCGACFSIYIPSLFNNFLLKFAYVIFFLYLCARNLEYYERKGIRRKIKNWLTNNLSPCCRGASSQQPAAHFLWERPNQICRSIHSRTIMGFFDELKQAGNSILEELQSDVADALDIRRTPLQERPSTHRTATDTSARAGSSQLYAGYQRTTIRALRDVTTPTDGCSRTTHRRDTRLVPRYGCMGTSIHTPGSGYTVQLVNCN